MGSFSPPKRNLTQKASMESGLYSQFSKATSFRSRANSLVSNQPSHIRNLRADLSVSVNSDPVNNVSIDGLRFTYVLALIEEWGGRAALEGKTTSQVGQDHIIGVTSHLRTSFCEHLQQFPDLSLNVRQANWFVSHVWEYKFLDVIDTLERFFMAKQIPLHEAVIWIDLFSISQNESDAEHKFEWWNNAILSAFKRIKNVVLVLENWFDPVPLKRSWCTYEIFCSTMARSNFNIALSESDETALIQSLYSDPSILYKSLSTFKSELSKATKLRDQQMIFKVLRHYIGFVKLNDLVFTVFRHWIFEFVQLQIDDGQMSFNTESYLRQAQWHQVKSELYELREMLPKAKAALSDCLTLREDHLGLEHPLTLKTKSQFAHISSQLGKIDYAESTLAACLSSQRQVIGSSHRDTLTTMSRLAFVYGEQDLIEESESLYKECILTASQTYGEDDLFAVSTSQDLANLYVSCDRLTDALPLYTETYTKLTNLKGPTDINTLFSAIGIAEVQYSLEEYTESEKVYSEISETVESTFGESSFQYAKQRTGLARVYRKTKRFDEAVSILTALSEHQQKSLGPNHILTVETNVALASAYWDQGSVDKAESLLATSLEKQRSILGTEDATTLETALLLAELYRKGNRFEPAESLTLEVYKIQGRVLGTEHVDTLTTQLGLAMFYFESNRVAYAHELLTDCLTKMKDVLGETHKLTIRAVENLATVERAMG